MNQQLPIGNQKTYSFPALLSLHKGTKVKYKGSQLDCGGYLTSGKTYELAVLGPDMFDNLEMFDDTGQLNSFKHHFFDIVYEDEYNTYKCECGADVTYGPDTEFHADYCPKYKKL